MTYDKEIHTANQDRNAHQPSNGFSLVFQTHSSSSVNMGMEISQVNHKRALMRVGYSSFILVVESITGVIITRSSPFILLNIANRKSLLQIGVMDRLSRRLKTRREDV